MKALAYEKAHPLDAFAIDLVDTAEPRPRDADLLVGVRAVGINPGEAAIRQIRSAEPGGRVILGWEFAGVVEAVGPEVAGFAVGDRVMGTGDWARDGAWAERLAVDHRVVARIPDQLSFSDAASLPIGGGTAWEALFRDQDRLPVGIERVLVIGGAGGVGTLATQLLKSRTSALVASTASRPETREWCTRMGADLVVDHTGDVPGQLRAAGIDRVDLVLSTAGTGGQVGWIAEILRPFGHLAAVDLNGPVDLGPLVAKSVSLHTETVFSRLLAGGNLAAQGGILAELAADAVAGRLRSITTTILDGLTVDTMRAAHEMAESRRTIGKTVITF
ncbi:alcohol dehydrogenase catalytic domain-containing protein [Amycolatopsis jiangsuensis]|uniref:Zinc-binding alcohol dehydrogenase family protein n=1 Tax=Amycolatopsis jiangsuensis TaxID=1181879 RepID=A0A840J385_9PSEU|nr:zinc-binding dehydrogenase [Amycolatopsis jiangsuensis]MBB4689526.1 zinc-binding alcohol dehydrogenase family protein [Amycolatopsis jiangsuensis]